MLHAGLVHRQGGANPFDGIMSNVVAVPRAVDWDGDGDMDLLLSGFHADGDEDASVRFFERLKDGSLILIGVLGSSFCFLGTRIPKKQHKHQFFLGFQVQYRIERVGLENPLHDFVADGEMLVVPRPIDWDSDGDVDFLVAGASGQIRYFKRLDDGSLQERLGAENPFDGVDVGLGSAVEVADWDGDAMSHQQFFHFFFI